MTPRSPHPGADLLQAIAWAVEREGALFTAGEIAVLTRIGKLPPDALELYARVTMRVGELFCVATLNYCCAEGNSVEELVERGLVHNRAPDDRARAAFPADALRSACRRLRLPTGGPRPALEERLKGQRWLDERVILVGHRALLERVSLLGGFDRHLAPVERIVGLRWEEYEPTGGAGAFADRRSLRRYEAARRGEFQAGEAETIARAGPPPFGRSPFRYARDAVLAGSPPANLLLDVPGCAIAAVRALEAEGRTTEALARCRSGDVDPEVAMGLARTGRRLARAARAAWHPEPPLISPQRRTFRLYSRGVSAGRPLWAPDREGEGKPVENALAALLADHERTAFHAENWFWTAVFALTFRPLYWLPVPGALPTRRRSGPVDLGTPSFHERRREAAEERLGRLADLGLGPLAAEWRGERLDGLSHAETAISFACRIEGTFLANVLRPLLRFGWSAARGLPDLVVLPGPATRIPAAFPSVLPECAFFAEIKGPTDSLRDAQRLWHDRLLKADNTVELWHVEKVFLRYQS